ncbi:putative d-mandelate dehydrogenase [Colletotrichum asianum]|uniref:Putative d-mandelate dehydrogenase n=1 Tax=Colletotrichum asianum TaxID=702518 RepID=A0A8H3ZNW5_9PEZI|nr:putative d-mandelate dehydrogenase [Colletotrichum asianum]
MGSTTSQQASKPTILLIESSVRGAETEQWDRIRSSFNIIKYDCQDEEEFCSRLAPGGPYSAIDAIVRVGWLKAGQFATHQLFRGPAIAKYPPSLKLICCSGHGYDAADIPALTARGITYANCPDTCTEAVANTALHLILNSFRYFTLAEHLARNDRWLESRRIGTMAVDPAGKILGIVGMGDIGIAIARKAALALDMKIHYHNRKPREDLQRIGAEAVYHESLESLLRVSDCICLACPLTPETKHMLCTSRFGIMKPEGVRIVNIARGGLIDEDALLEAMKSGRVVGLGLDVHAAEPTLNPKLKENYDTTLLPHIGVCSGTSWNNFDKITLTNLEEWFFGDKTKVTAVDQV